MMKASQSPPAFSVARIASLVGCILVTLTSSGTIYLYSAYSPQLGGRLHASYTELNVIGYAAHMGSNLSGPIWGRLIDKTGPRLPLIASSVCYLIGFGGITRVYDVGIGTETSLPRALFAILAVCNFLTGSGSSASVSLAYTTTAKNFPTEMRARAIGFVAAGMGLSAFFWTTISRVFLAGNTSGLLLLLTFVTSLIPTMCSVVVRLIPPSLEEGAKTLPNTQNEVLITTVRDVEEDCHTPLLHDRPNNDYYVSASPSTIPGSRICSHSHPQIDLSTDIHGKQLLACPEYYTIVLIMLALSGTGVMYINNVGVIARALYIHSNPDYDEVEAFKWQNTQVTMLSIGSFSSRLVIGFVADLVRTQLHAPRSYCLCIVSMLFIISQIIAIGVSTVNTLWIASALVGAAYGSLLAIVVTIIADWFGLAHLSENFGYVFMPLSIGGNLLSFMFGQVIDAHTPPRTWGLPALLSESLPAEYQCMRGRECYVTSLWVTLLLSIAAFGLSTWAGIRDGRRERVRKDIMVGLDDRDL